MENETQQIFEEQLKKLPTEVVDFLSSANWEENLDEIGSLYNLSEDELYNFKSEATLVLEGLVHPDEFGNNLEQEAGIHGAVRDAIVATVEQRIFAPVRSALVDFIKREEGDEVESRKSKVESGDKETTPAEVPSAPPVPNAPRNPNLTPKTSNLKPSPHLSGVAPDNLPVAEPPEYLTPPIPPKSANLDVGHPSEHPFEEKMKRVFTAGQQSMGELTLEPASQNFPQENLGGQAVPQTPTPARLAHDPYREAIE